MNYKKLSIRFVALVVFILSSLNVLYAYLHIRDKSWMATLDALGGLGATEKVWAQFIIGIMLTISSIVVFVMTFRRKTPLS